MQARLWPSRLMSMPLPDHWLLSGETGAPFSHCIHCRFPLLELDCPWLVNKDFHKGECTLEYAICEKCRDQVSEEFSADSKEAVRRFLEDEIPWEERIESYLHDHERRYSHCVACDCPQEHAEGYASSVLFDSSGEVDLGPLPLMICSNCTEQMGETLSPATRDSWERFLNDHFDSPPRLSTLPRVL